MSGEIDVTARELVILGMASRAATRRRSQNGKARRHFAGELEDLMRVPVPRRRDW
jgi:hypothetical protein